MSEASATPGMTRAQMIAALCRDGYTVGEIAERMNISRHSVRARVGELRRRGEDVRPAPTPRAPTITDQVRAMGAGRSISEIAEELGVARAAVRTALKTLRRRGEPVTTVRDPRMRVERVRRLAEAGMTPAQIAAELMCSRNAVYCTLTRLRGEGLPIRRYGPRPGTTVAAVVAGASAGKAAQEIADELDIPVNHVYAAAALARRNGLELPSLAAAKRPQGTPRPRPPLPDYEPFPISVTAEVAASDAAVRGIAWEGDRDSIARLNAARTARGLAPMWVNPKELRR